MGFKCGFRVMGFLFWVKVWGVEENVVCNFLYWQVMVRWWGKNNRSDKKEFLFVVFCFGKGLWTNEGWRENKMKDFCCFLLCIKKSWWNITGDIHNWGAKKDGLTKKKTTKDYFGFLLHL
jgi:hypothetical protein